MSIERERYEQMTAPASWWQRFKRLFVFPPLPVKDPPTELPRGGPTEFFGRRELRRLKPGEMVYLRGDEPPPAAPSLDELHPAFERPVIGYMSEIAFRLLRDTEGWWGPVYRDRAELTRGGVVEVEVRFRRIVEEQASE